MVINFRANLIRRAHFPIFPLPSMLPPRHAAALTLLALSGRSAAAAPCSANDTVQLDKLADSMGGLLRYCQTDSGFTLYPFTGFPPSDKATIVCSGRSCPSAIYNFLQAKLPECTVAVQGKAMTPAEYLRALCPSNATPATSPPTTTTPAPTPNNGATTAPPTTPPTTTTPSTPSSAPATTTASPSGMTTTPTTTTPTTTTPPPSNNPGAGSSSSADSGSPSVDTPPASEAASVPTRAPPTRAPAPAPQSSACLLPSSGLVSTGAALLVAAALQLL